MNILYGIQSIGNGHIARARLLVPALREAGANVDCLFSGRDPENFFNMEIFGKSSFRDGLRLVYRRGKLDPLKTAYDVAKRMPRLMFDIMNLEIDGYDLVLCDGELISSLAAKFSGKYCIDISNFNAMKCDIPKPDMSFLQKFGLNYVFTTPADQNIGMHWSDFGQKNIMPPFVAPKSELEPGDPKKVLVYLNFEDLTDVKQLLKPFSTDYEFFIYSPDVQTDTDDGKMHFKAFSQVGFKSDMAICGKFISNAGFSLTTEALQEEKSLLVKPMAQQPEQIANAMALKKLHLASTMDSLDEITVGTFLDSGAAYNKISFPDTVKAIAQWIIMQDWNSNSTAEIQPLIDNLWKQVQLKPAQIFSVQP